MTRSISSPNLTLMDQARFYQAQLIGSPAEEYLAKDRGLNPRDVHRYGIGYSGEVEPGHDMYRDRLVIPYLRYMADEWFVIGLKFRRLGETGAKYLGDTSPNLYNTVAAIENDDEIAITEGEIDALTATISGVPAVGVPGVDTWSPIWTPIFQGYERVWVFADGDQPGRDFASRLRKLIGPEIVRVIDMPDGHDVNSFVRDNGPPALRRLIGRD